MLEMKEERRQRWGRAVSCAIGGLLGIAILALCVMGWQAIYFGETQFTEARVLSVDTSKEIEYLWGFEFPYHVTDTSYVVLSYTANGEEVTTGLKDVGYSWGEGDIVPIEYSVAEPERVKIL